MPDHDLFHPFTPEERQSAREVLFPTISPETFVFGFVGPNQIRKDPQKLIRAFAELKERNPNRRLALYMHTNFAEGVFNLKKYCQSYGLMTGDILVRPVGAISPFDKMPDIYNAMDCFVNPSMQEGLSWTTIQAMKCGVPTIASNSTAHIELVQDYGILVPCDCPSYIPIKSDQGQTWIDAKSCSASELMNSMSIMLGDDYSVFRSLALQGADEMTMRLQSASDISDYLENRVIEIKTPVQERILFMQHGSAGDVLMTTRCLGPLREKHASYPITYMTQKQFFGILKNNPNVDEIIEWNPGIRNEFRFVYNPHGEHILHGNFNSLDVKLADMYPYFCGVEPGNFFIYCEKSPFLHDLWEHENLANTPYIVVHTTGGDPQFRTYDHMGMVIMGLNIPVIQIGGKADLYCKGAIDLRGILSFTETAWVMKHAKAAVVIDSFPSHLAGALGIPAIVLYGPAPARVVGPIHDREIPWFDMEPDKLRVCKNTYNCYGRDRQCISPCINSIHPMTIKKNLKMILGM